MISNMDLGLANTYMVIRYRANYLHVEGDRVTKFIELLSQLVRAEGVHTYTFGGVERDDVTKNTFHYIELYVVGNGIVMYVKVYPIYDGDRDVEAITRDFPFSIGEVPSRVDLDFLNVNVVVDSFADFNDAQKLVVETMSVVGLSPQLIRPM